MTKNIKLAKENLNSKAAWFGGEAEELRREGLILSRLAEATPKERGESSPLARMISRSSQILLERAKYMGQNAEQLRSIASSL